MDTKIISVINQKGGCGKTTLTMQLSGKFGLDGFSVLVVDADTQGTATKWAANAQEGKPFPARIAGLGMAGQKLHQEVKKYIGQFDYIFIDCPPAVNNPVPQSALLISDLALVPIIPSPADLWATLAIQELISHVTAINENLYAMLVPNMCQSNTSLCKEAVDVIKQYEIPSSKTNIYLRTAYKQSAVCGNTVFSLKNAEKSQEEIKKLQKEIVKLLNK